MEESTTSLVLQTLLTVDEVSPFSLLNSIIPYEATLDDTTLASGTIKRLISLIYILMQVFKTR